MINNTTIQQRSLNASWITGDRNGVPSDVIVDLQFTIPADLGTDIWLVSLNRDDTGTLYMAFAAGDNATSAQMIAQLMSDVTGTPLRMDSVPGVSASVLLGTIPDRTQEYVTSPVKISKALIHSYDPARFAANAPHLYVVQAEHDATLLDEIISDDMIFTVADDVLKLSGTGNIIVDIVDNGDISLSQISGIYKNIRTINHVSPNASGEICIELNSNPGAEVDLTADVHNEYCVTLAASDGLNAALAPEDLIDKHIKHKTGAGFDYYPLDDAYVYAKSNDKFVRGETRRTFETLGADTYRFPMITRVNSEVIEFFDDKGEPSDKYIQGGSFTGGRTSVSGTSAALRTLEPMYDTTTGGLE